MNSFVVRNKKKKSISKYFVLDISVYRDVWRENLLG